MNLKQVAGEKAVEYVKNGGVVGLGTGSTVFYAIKKIGEKVKNGLDIVGIPTSVETEKLAKQFGIQLSTLEEHPVIDVTIDGADEIDKKLNLIKGMGGALLREKIVASASKKEVIVADDSKLVDMLGTKSFLPVEVARFGWSYAAKKISEFDCKPELRKKDGKIFITDNGNYILDCKFKSIMNPKEMEEKINNIPGVVENGLFIGLADVVVVASEKGVRIIEK
ncbi:MAG: ribose-5-phosphate isomerase RpiA [Thermoplasmatales archaeon]|nr:ribose-5-phosphate isomerase RpiA [Candidatus Thermoplasmatota archaeon]MCG2825758.1 ribose-5-phosphate isomerase RpiA [Thermoplasmatales archaeon]